jgi:hypothetical protein
MLSVLVAWCVDGIFMWCMSGLHVLCVFVCVHYLPRVLSCSYRLLCSCDKLRQQESSNRIMSMAPIERNLINGPLGLTWAA